MKFRRIKMALPLSAPIAMETQRVLEAHDIKIITMQHGFSAASSSLSSFLYLCLAVFAMFQFSTLPSFLLFFGKVLLACTIITFSMLLALAFEQEQLRCFQLATCFKASGQSLEEDK